MLRALLFVLVTAPVATVPISHTDDVVSSKPLVDRVLSRVCASPSVDGHVLDDLAVMTGAEPGNNVHSRELFDLAQGISDRRHLICDVKQEESVEHPTPRSDAADVPPFILFPGLTAPQLEAKYDIPLKERTPHFYCERHSREFHLLWMNPEAFVPGFRDCWEWAMAMSYDEVSGKFMNQSGVGVRAVDFGNMDNQKEWKMFGKVLPMYLDFINNATARGFVSNKTMFAAQYDFRLDPESLMRSDYLANVMALVDHAYAINGNRKVSLVGHSYGSAVAHRFLRHVPQAWKESRIAQYVSLCGPYGGSGAALEMLLTGQSSQKHGLGFTSDELTTIARNISTAPALMPIPELVGGNDSIAVSTPDANITYAQLPAYLDSIGLSKIVQYQRLSHFDLAPPGVPVHCINGYGIGTPVGFIFNTSDVLHNVPIASRNVTGDSVVPRSSLNICQGWKTQQSEPVTSLEIQGLNHGFGLFEPKPMNIVLDILTAN